MGSYDKLLMELLRRLDEKADKLIELLEVRQNAEHGRDNSTKADYNSPNNF